MLIRDKVCDMVDKLVQAIHANNTEWKYFDQNEFIGEVRNQVVQEVINNLKANMVWFVVGGILSIVKKVEQIGQ